MEQKVEDENSSPRVMDIKTVANLAPSDLESSVDSNDIVVTLYSDAEDAKIKDTPHTGSGNDSGDENMPPSPPALVKQYTILTEQDVPLPYKKDSYPSRAAYHIKTLFVSNPRLFTIYLLWGSIGPRILIIIDLLTDIGVAIQLFEYKFTTLFSLSLLFLSFPFMMVWMSSLRFCQRFIQTRLKKHDNNILEILFKNTKNKQFIKLKNSEKANKISYGLFNIFLISYLFPPIGCVLVTLYELLYVCYDCIHGALSFLKGEIMIIDKNAEVESFKQFRKAIEFFGVLNFVCVYDA